mgnify:CR=1 FL=1
MSFKTPKKFVGLHAHSGFSTFDGLGYPQEHIDFVRSNGMDAWALTDHGHMNGFCHAYLHSEKLNAAGANFKLIPGCEMYVHPDLEVWRLDYEIKKATKKGDEDALQALRLQRKELSTPLLASTDEDNASVDGGSGEAGLTIEDEDASKSSKFYDPIKRRHHLVVLPTSSEGLERLFGLVSKGYIDGFYRFPRVDYKMLREAAEGGHLIISTACIGGPLAYEIFSHFQGVEFDDLKPELLDNEHVFEKVLASVADGYQMLADALGVKNVYLELQFNKLNAQHLVNRALLEFAKRNDLTSQLIVTCDSHYSHPDHWKERELYKKLGWLNYRDFDPSELPQSREDLKCELYPKNAEQVWETYKTTGKDYDFYDDSIICDAVERTHTIAHEVIGEIHPDKKMKLPSYVIPKDKTANQALIELCKEGIVARGLHQNPAYVSRLKEELGVIQQKNFSEYFLTMKAIIDVARKKMFVGPGRGSGAGSLVNYVLKITDVDPIKYNLLFERFLSVDRSDAPDIDSDVGDRDELITLLREEFGANNVIPISNYNTFRLKSLIKDVSRFYDIEFDEVNKALRPLDREVKRGQKADGIDGGFHVKLEDAIKYSTTLGQYFEKYPEVVEPLSILYNQNKSLGRHAGGVIISERIPERMPLIKAKGELQTPWVEGMNHKHLEKIGWIKFDLLGLETLRVIERTIYQILQKEGIANPTFDQVFKWFEENMSPNVIDLDDQHVYEHVYHDGRFCGTFQCTQPGAQRLFKKAKPRSIIDIATLTSIYRPGPLSAKVDKIYLKAKQAPENIFYGHPLIEEILESTYGTICFQEQVMALCNKVAGIPKAETNAMRKMMKPSGSSSDAVEKAKSLHTRFMSGCIENGVNESIAADLYEKILFFAGYGFNLSHAVSYSINSYWCAWLLTYHEEEWIKAYLEACSSNPGKREKAIKEVKTLGYSIVPIDINFAERNWTTVGNKQLMPSFLSCKGLGSRAVEEILCNRPYTSIYDVLWTEEGKWRHSKFNKRSIESLIKLRGFESLDIAGTNKMFESYQHMHEVIMGGYDSFRRSLKKNPYAGRDSFEEYLANSERLEEWSSNELVSFEKELVGSVNIEALLPEEFKEKLIERDISALDEWNKEEIYWFMVTEAIQKLTKNKKPYLLLKTMSSSGKESKMFCWGTKIDANVDPFSLCVALVSNGDFGYTTRWQKLKIINI